jgi:hypothetical protein
MLKAYTISMSMGTIRVGNKHAGSKLKPAADEVAIDVDRKNPVLGNPHYLKNPKDRQERALCIAQYDVDYQRDWEQNGPMRKATEMIAERVKNGEKIYMGCWCKPEACHADLIEARVRQILGIELPKQASLDL